MSWEGRYSLVIPQMLTVEGLFSCRGHFLFCYVVNQIKDLFFRPTDRQKILFKSLNVFVTQTRHFEIHPFHLPKFNYSALQPRIYLAVPGHCWGTYAPTNHALTISALKRTENSILSFRFVVERCCYLIFYQLRGFLPKMLETSRRKNSSLRMSFSSMLHPKGNTNVAESH